MEKSEETIKKDWHRLDNENISIALELLRRSDCDIRLYLADCVASVCGIHVEEMFINTDTIHLAHARWLYWYAYRYMTNESYAKILEDTPLYGDRFAERSVHGGVNKMAMMIVNEPIWQRRWGIIKRIIKLRDHENEIKEDNNIIIHVPKGMLNDKIRITIKEK